MPGGNKRSHILKQIEKKKKKRGSTLLSEVAVTSNYFAKQSSFKELPFVFTQGPILSHNSHKTDFA